MAPRKPLVIELTKDTASFPKGTQLGVDTESDAAKFYGETYTIVGYQDGSAYEPPASTHDEPADPQEPDASAAPEAAAPTAEQHEV